MKERIYVRVARRPNWSMHRGSRYKIDAGPTHNPRPLMVGSERSRKLLKTIHFAIDIEIPDKIFDDPAMPVVKMTLESGKGYAVEPNIAQVTIEPQAEHDHSLEAMCRVGCPAYRVPGEI